MRRCGESLGTGRRGLSLRILPDALSAQSRRCARYECRRSRTIFEVLLPRSSERRKENVETRLGLQPVNISELIYDSNPLYPNSLHPPGPVRLTDATLRDGLQSPSVRDPSIEQKIEIMHLMQAVAINTLD